jgi:hypothetical protein
MLLSWQVAFRINSVCFSGNIKIRIRFANFNCFSSFALKLTPFKMKKIIFSVVFVTMAFGAAFSQGRFSAGLELAPPLGTFGDIANIGIGGSVRYEAPIQDKLNWTGTAGFISFGGKSIGGFSYSSFSMIPIQGGVKYYFTESFEGFYASGELGFSIVSYSIPGISFLGTTVGGGTASSTKFGFAPGAGYHLGNLDFSARFQLVSDFNYFNIRAAYVFGGK